MRLIPTKTSANVVLSMSRNMWIDQLDMFLNYPSCRARICTFELFAITPVVNLRLLIKFASQYAVME